MAKSGALITKKVIMDYLEVGDGDFVHLVAAGLPIRKMPNGRLIAHPDNLDEFLRQYTRARLKDPKDANDNGGGYPDSG